MIQAIAIGIYVHLTNEKWLKMCQNSWFFCLVKVKVKVRVVTLDSSMSLALFAFLVRLTTLIVPKNVIIDWIHEWIKETTETTKESKSKKKKRKILFVKGFKKLFKAKLKC